MVTLFEELFRLDGLSCEAVALLPIFQRFSLSAVQSLAGAEAAPESREVNLIEHQPFPPSKIDWLAQSLSIDDFYLPASWQEAGVFFKAPAFRCFWRSCRQAVSELHSENPLMQ